MKIQPGLRSSSIPGAADLCCSCHCRITISHSWADLDGKAFEAYYCADCVQEVSTSQERLLGMLRQLQMECEIHWGKYRDRMPDFQDADAVVHIEEPTGDHSHIRLWTKEGKEIFRPRTPESWSKREVQIMLNFAEKQEVAA